MAKRVPCRARAHLLAGTRLLGFVADPGIEGRHAHPGQDVGLLGGDRGERAGRGQDHRNGVAPVGQVTGGDIALDAGRIALLSDAQWVAWSAWLSQLFVDPEIRVFDDEGLARAWLDGSEP